MRRHQWQRRIVTAGLAALGLATLSGAVADAPPQGEKTLQWRLSVSPGAAANEVELVFAADIASGWILYASDFEAEFGPRPAKFSFKPNEGIELVGPTRAVRSLRRTDKTWNTEYSYFEKRAEFRQTVRLRNPETVVEGRIDGQTCYEVSGLCELFTEPFTLQVRKP
jgi:hypothetical protein